MTYLKDRSVKDWHGALEALDDSIRCLNGFSTMLEFALAADGGSLKNDSYGIGELLNRQIEDIKEIGPFLRDEINHLQVAKLDFANRERISRLSGVSPKAVERVLYVVTGEHIASDAEGAQEGNTRQEMLDAIMSRMLVDQSAIEVVAEVADVPVSALTQAFNTVFVLELDKVKTMERAEYVAYLRRLTASPAAAPDTGDDKATAKSLRYQFIEEKAKEGVDPAEIAQAVNLKRSTVERVIKRLKAGTDTVEPDTGSKAVND